jgi:hypothetical protein
MIGPRKPNPVATFARVAPYVIAFMMGLLMGAIIGDQQFKSQCRRYFAYHLMPPSVNW